MNQLDEERIEAVLDEKVRPVLQVHDGGVELLGIDANGAIRLRLAGACAACPGASDTIRDVIVAALRESLPEAREVLVEAGVSQDLVEEALRFLKREK